MTTSPMTMKSAESPRTNRWISMLLATLIAIYALPALAAEPEVETAESFELLQRAIAGDLDALQALDNDGEAPRWDLFLRGHALRANDRNDEAVAAWQESVALGQRLAARMLAVHHYDQRDWVEAYAWARLAMEVDAALADADLDDLRGRWSLYTAIHAAEELDSDQHAAADALARERVGRYLSVLVAPEEVGSAGVPSVEELEIVERRRPVYPRAMAESRQPGWSYLQFEVLPDGRVGDVVVLGASNDRFARAAARAIRKWRFNADALETLPKTASQLIDFNLRRSA